MYVQKAIIDDIASRENKEYRMATPAEESKGIDGYVEGTSYSVKPVSYRNKESLIENIESDRMAYYTKTDAGLSFEIEEIVA